MRLFICLLVFCPFFSGAQPVADITGRITGVKTEADANAFLKKNKDLVGHVLTYDSTDALFEYLDSLEVAEVMTREADKDSQEIDLIKILTKRRIQLFQVQYIYLDASKLSITQIDSLRQLIIKKNQAGESFESLVQQYSMDGNAKNGGLLTWHKGDMVEDFQRGVEQRLPGEVFTIDVPKSKWFYVVKNSEKPRMSDVITVLYIKVRK